MITLKTEAILSSEMLVTTSVTTRGHNSSALPWKLPICNCDRHRTCSTKAAKSRLVEGWQVFRGDLWRPGCGVWRDAMGKGGGAPWVLKFYADSSFYKLQGSERPNDTEQQPLQWLRTGRLGVSLFYVLLLHYTHSHWHSVTETFFCKGIYFWYWGTDSEQATA
jgi:hypothetical protein